MHEIPKKYRVSGDNPLTHILASPHRCSFILGDEHLVGRLDVEGIMPTVDHRQGGIHAEDVWRMDITIHLHGCVLGCHIAGPDAGVSQIEALGRGKTVNGVQRLLLHAR